MYVIECKLIEVSYSYLDSSAAAALALSNVLAQLGLKATG